MCRSSRSNEGRENSCFVVSKVGDIEKDLIRYTEDKLGKAFAPSEIKIVKELPKTRNAKIMRRLIRAVYLNKPLGDISSLENPSALEEIKRALIS